MPHSGDNSFLKKLKHLALCVSGNAGCKNIPAEAKRENNSISIGVERK
jgi:hypothetical protein